MRLVKLLGLLATLAAALLTALVWFGGERLLARYKPEIERLLSDAAGGPVRVSSLRITLLPRLGLEARGVRMHPPNGGSPWRIDHLDLLASLRALLHRRLEIHRVLLTGLDAEVRTTARDTAGGDAGSHPWRGMDFRLDRFELRNSRVTVVGETGQWELSLGAANGALSRRDNRLVISKATLWGTAAEVPFELAGDGLTWEEGVARVRHMALNLGPARLSLSGQLGPASALQGKITAHGLDLPSLPPFLARAIGMSSPAFRGTFDAEIDLSGTLDATNVSAAISGKSLSFGASRISRLDLTRLDATITDSAFRSAALEAAVSGLEIQDGEQRYRADGGTVQGTVERASGWKMKGAISAKNFGFADGTTDIRQVDARVSDIKGIVSKSGDVTVDMILDGSSILLKAPSVEVTSVEKVSSPLRVSVPSRGGYAVSGPVNATGASLVLEGRKLDPVSGTVDILVSGPLKEFKTVGLEARSAGENLRLSTTFSMLSDAYRARLTALEVGGGTLQGSWSMGRRTDLAVTADVSASTVDIGRAYLAVMQKEGALRGTLQSLKLNAAARRGNLLESLKGTGSFVLYGESSKTRSLRDQIWRAAASVPGVGGLAGGEDRLDNPEDRETRAEADITDGKVHLKKFTAKRSGYTVEGEPRVSFRGELGGSIYLVFLKEKLRALGFGIEALGDLFSRSARISIPLTLSGTVNDPGVTPDYVAIAKAASGLGLAQSIVDGVTSQGKKIGRALTGGGNSPAKTGRDEAPPQEHR